MDNVGEKQRDLLPPRPRRKAPATPKQIPRSTPQSSTPLFFRGYLEKTSDSHQSELTKAVLVKFLSVLNGESIDNQHLDTLTELLQVTWMLRLWELCNLHVNMTFYSLPLPAPGVENVVTGACYLKSTIDLPSRSSSSSSSSRNL